MSASTPLSLGRLGELALEVVDRTDLRFRDLRHAFANWACKDGAVLDGLRSLLEHKDRLTTSMQVTVERLGLG